MAAAVIPNRMLSLPETRLRSETSSSTTFFSARALIRRTVAMSRSTSVSVISRSRQYSRAASRVSLISSGCARRWLGASAAARARQAASTFGAMPPNSPAGSPVARIAVSLAISCRVVFRLTLPGSALMTASTSGPSWPSPLLGIVAGIGDERGHARCCIRRDPSGDPQGQGLLCLPHRGTDDPADPARGRRLDPLASAVLQELLAHALGTALLAADMLGQPGSELVGVGYRALPETQDVRIWARWHSNVRPDHSYSPRSAAGTFTWRAT